MTNKEEILPKTNNVCGWCKKININGHWVEFKRKDINNFSYNYPKRKSFISQFPDAEEEYIWRCNGKCSIKRNQNRKNENSPTSFVFLKNENNDDVFKRVNNLEKKCDICQKDCQELQKRKQVVSKRHEAAIRARKGDPKAPIWECSKCREQVIKKKLEKGEKKRKEKQISKNLKIIDKRVENLEVKHEKLAGETEETKKQQQETENRVSELEENKMVKRGEKLKELEEAFEKIKKKKQEEREKNTIHINLFSLKTRFHQILWGTLAVALIIALFVSWWKWKAIEEWLDKPIEEDEDEDL